MLILAEYSIFITYFVMLVMGLCLILEEGVDLYMGRVMRVGFEGLRMLGLGGEVLIVRVSECQPFPRDRRWICTGSACMICTVLYL